MAIPSLDLTTLLGQWPRDFSAQQAYLNRLLNILADYESQISNNLNTVVVLEQAIEPTSDEWEAAWTAQTGQVPPVPPVARLYWWDTSIPTFGGEYGTVEGNSTVVRREHAYPHGATIYLDMAWDSTTRTNTDLYALRGTLPSLTMEIPVVCDIQLHGYAGLTAPGVGNGGIGMDFMLSNAATGEEIKVGTDQYGVDPNDGITSTEIEGQLQTTVVYPNLQPGTWLVEMLIGYIGAPAVAPAWSIGGTSMGAYYMIARAIVKD